MTTSLESPQIALAARMNGAGFEDDANAQLEAIGEVMNIGKMLQEAHLFDVPKTGVPWFSYLAYRIGQQVNLQKKLYLYHQAQSIHFTMNEGQTKNDLNWEVIEMATTFARISRFLMTQANDMVQRGSLLPEQFQLLNIAAITFADAVPLENWEDGKIQNTKELEAWKQTWLTVIEQVNS